MMIVAVSNMVPTGKSIAIKCPGRLYPELSKERKSVYGYLLYYMFTVVSNDENLDIIFENISYCCARQAPVSWIQERSVGFPAISKSPSVMDERESDLMIRIVQKYVNQLRWKKLYNDEFHHRLLSPILLRRGGIKPTSSH
mmetsp:Transcript_5628/g.11905  ORF Transcript_5628/g.11905 Transcript_5628/m.11905 type:complete len:141 (+) Transcript_5628:801-1223(+)